MRTMKAAVVPELGAKLEIRELPVPEPGPGQVLIRMQASGLCHTDIHAAAGDWPVKPSPPFTPGHEGVGIIESELVNGLSDDQDRAGGPVPGELLVQRLAHRSAQGQRASDVHPPVVGQQRRVRVQQAMLG